MDFQRVDEPEKSGRVRALLHSLSRNISTLAICRRSLLTCKQMTVLFRIKHYPPSECIATDFVIEDQPAWQPSLRSKTALRTSAKRQMVDPSIAVAVRASRKNLARFQHLWISV